MAIVDFEGFDSFLQPAQVAGRFTHVTFATNNHTSALGSGVFNHGRAYKGLNSTLELGRNISPKQTLWLNFHLRWPNVTAPGNSIVQLRDGTTIQLGLRNDAAGFLTLYRSTTLIATSTKPIITGLWHFIQIRAHIASVGGTCEIWIDNEKALDFSGNTQASANAIINQWRLQGNLGLHEIDNLILYDETGAEPNARTVETRLFSHLPDADGALSEWTPNAGSNRFSRVNENPPDADTTYNSAASAPLTDLYTFPAEIPAGSTVYGVAAQGVARKDDAGTNEVDFVARIAGTDYVAGAPGAVAADYGSHRHVWLTNPATGAAWSPAAVNNAQIGLRRTT